MTPPIAPLIAAGIAAPHGFFTREGGVSAGPFASLNGSLSGADDPAHVAENRARIAAHLGATTLLGLHQVHGPAVVTVTTPWRPGEGPRADALVTAIPGLALGVITADCAPVLFHAPAQRIVGAAHAGWRSALAGVLEATVAAMRALGATTVHAAIGPCIQQPSYEVGLDLRDAILAHDPAHAAFLAPGRPGHWHFDLPAYCAARLAGLARTENIPADTLQDHRFWSHRRRTLAGGHPIGHQVSAIALV